MTLGAIKYEGHVLANKNSTLLQVAEIRRCASEPRQSPKLATVPPDAFIALMIPYILGLYVKMSNYLFSMRLIALFKDS